jgi:hypothetical protein
MNSAILVISPKPTPVIDSGTRRKEHDLKTNRNARAGLMEWRKP